MTVRNDNPFVNLWNSSVNETGRAFNEAGRHMGDSINEISRATETGGFVGGIGTAFDKLTPGNVAAGAIDSIMPGADMPKPVAEGISAGVNLFVGALIPGPGAVLQAMALVDGYQAVAAMGSEAPQASEGQRMQTPDRPASALERAKEQKLENRAEARRQAINEARTEAKDRLHEKAQTNRISDLEARVTHLEELAGVQESQPGGGYGGMDDIELDGSRFRGGKGSEKLNKLEQDLRDASAEIDRILNNPNLAFEDMIFLLMRAVIKQSESEVNIGLEQEKGARDADRVVRDGSRAEISGLQDQLQDLNTQIAAEPDAKKKEGLTAKAQNLRTTIEQKQTSLGDDLQDKTESRGERFEALKESLQKIGEMEQALSNIMNALHQTAQNAIGNIR